MIDYITVPQLKLLLLNFPMDMLKNIQGIEFDPKKHCYYFEKNSKTHTWVAIKYPELFKAYDE